MTVSSIIYANLLSVLFAYILDTLLGDPKTAYHPIAVLGRFISYLEAKFYKHEGKSGGFEILAVTLIASVIAVSVLIVFSAYFGANAYILINTIILYFCISVRSLQEHAMDVFAGLMMGDTDRARKSLSLIVSRDTAELNSPQIASSVIESVSENFTDGAVSPIFYGALLGGLGGVIFKAVSTLDSMIGYKNERYIDFGRLSAKTDDVLNFIPARLAVFPVYVASMILNFNSREVFSTYREFKDKHESPNAAHSMSAFAGALQVKLGGDMSYFGHVKQKPVIGSGREPAAEDILRAVRLMKVSSLVWLFLCITVLTALI